MVELRDKNYTQALLRYPSLSPGISLVWAMKSLSLFHLFSVHLWHSLVPYCSDRLSGVVYTCLLLYHFWNIKLTAIVFSLFIRKALRKKELLIKKKTILIQNTRERNIKVTCRWLGKNVRIMTGKWLPTAVSHWVFF